MHERHPKADLGIFTSIAVKNGQPVLFDRHLQRLQRSCEVLYGQKLPESVEHDAVRAVSSMNDNQRLRIEAIPIGGSVEIRMQNGPMPGDDSPLSLVSTTVHDGNGNHKWIDRSALQGQPALLVDDKSLVLECTTANVFVVFDGQIITPPLDGRILPGIARSIVVDSNDTREEPISYEMLTRADEVFATNALHGIISVVRCDEHAWTPGPVTADLLRAWQADVLGSY
jgi:para-aminobenzoate synthetase/4-amino-4-deoxychorismate lyase